MSDPALFAANLAALRGMDPDLAASLERSTVPAGLDAILSRSGHRVPRISVAGRPAPLHSTVDPVREAERATAAAPRVAYCLCLGLGGGYHLPFLLARPGTERLVVVESDPGTLRGLLSIVDMQRLIADSRLALIAPPRPEQVADALLADYFPAAYPSFGTFTLRARQDASPAYFAAARQSVDQALAWASRDYTVQTRFGWRWLRNTLANLRALEERGGRTPALPPRTRTTRILVSGAGPSLERQFARIAALRGDSYLLATDASLAPLLGAGIVPDAVLSVDCQHVAYHHFLAGMPRSCLLLLDLASPPLLGRLGSTPAHVATHHPLSRYLAAKGLNLPEMDVTGGNVSHAAVSLARALGAEEIRLFGVDLSYPSGKPYARGCFLYPALAARSARLAPLESAVAAFVLASAGTRRVSAPCGAAYVPEPMAAYRVQLERLAASAGARVVQEPGCGPPLDLRVPPTPTAVPGPAAQEERAPSRPVPELLSGYARDLRDLPAPSGSFAAYLRPLSRGHRLVLATLLPVAAAYQAGHGFPTFAAAFEPVRRSVLRAMEESGDTRP